MDFDAIKESLPSFAHGALMTMELTLRSSSMCPRSDMALTRLFGDGGDGHDWCGDELVLGRDLHNGAGCILRCVFEQWIELCGVSEQ